MKLKDELYVDSALVEFEPVKDIIISLKTVIVEMSKNSETAKTLIQKLANELDERKLCKTDEISRKIKQTLKDEIREGKITARWIEDSLSGKYKRPYCKKCEVGSLFEEASTVGQAVQATEEVKPNTIVPISTRAPQMVSDEVGFKDYSSELDTESGNQPANPLELAEDGTSMNPYDEGIGSEYLCAFMIGKSAIADAGTDQSNTQESSYALISNENFLIVTAASLKLDLKHTLHKQYSQVSA